MIDPITARPAGAFSVETGGAVQVANGPGVVSPQDQALFEERLNAPHMEDIVTVEINQEAKQPAIWVLQGPPAPPGVLSLGERILQGMNSFHDTWEGALSSVEMLTTRTDIQPNEMINIQFQIGYSSMMLATISQEVGSVSQKIDGLLKTG